MIDVDGYRCGVWNMIEVIKRMIRSLLIGLFMIGLLYYCL